MSYVSNVEKEGFVQHNDGGNICNLVDIPSKVQMFKLQFSFEYEL